MNDDNDYYSRMTKQVENMAEKLYRAGKSTKSILRNASGMGDRKIFRRASYYGYKSAVERGIKKGMMSHAHEKSREIADRVLKK